MTRSMFWTSTAAMSQLSWNFKKLHKKSELPRKMVFWGARERIWPLQPLKKHRNYLSFCMPAPYVWFLANSMKFIENEEIQWNFMKFMKFHEIHEIPWNSVISWIPRPFTKPLYSLLKIKVWAAWTPQNLKIQKKRLISWNAPKFQ